MAIAEAKEGTLYEVEAIAPGKVILFGEHAVVHGRPGIAAAAGIYTAVEAGRASEGVEIDAGEYGIARISFTELDRLMDRVYELRDAYNRDKSKDKPTSREIRKLTEESRLIPGLVAVAEIGEDYGHKPIRARISSAVTKNLGSSASVNVGLVAAVSELLGYKFSKEETAYYANEAERAVHITPSGIDANTITYGGYLVKTGARIEHLILDFEFPLIIVNSGEAAKTSEMVEKVWKIKETQPKIFEETMKKAEKITNTALSVMETKDLEKVGKLMTLYYKALNEFDISTPKLDDIVDTAMKKGALGAKPTGGWGGGNCIVLAKDDEQRAEIIKEFEDDGYDAFTVRLGVPGVAAKSIKSS